MSPPVACSTWADPRALVGVHAFLDIGEVLGEAPLTHPPAQRSKDGRRGIRRPLVAGSEADREHLQEAVGGLLEQLRVEGPLAELRSERLEHRGLADPDGCHDPRPDLVGPLPAAVAIEDARLRAEVRHELMSEDLIEGGADGSEGEQAEDGSLDHRRDPSVACEESDRHLEPADPQRRKSS